MQYILLQLKNQKWEKVFPSDGYESYISCRREMERLVGALIERRNYTVLKDYGQTMILEDRVLHIEEV